jgi:hypothetical protein
MIVFRARVYQNFTSFNLSKTHRVENSILTICIDIIDIKPFAYQIGYDLHSTLSCCVVHRCLFQVIFLKEVNIHAFQHFYHFYRLLFVWDKDGGKNEVLAELSGVGDISHCNIVLSSFR